MDNSIFNFLALSQYKRVFRAIKRGHITLKGVLIPKRPFNNRANTSKRKGVHSRVINERKKYWYVQLYRKSL